MIQLQDNYVSNQNESIQNHTYATWYMPYTIGYVPYANLLCPETYTSKAMNFGTWH